MAIVRLTIKGLCLFVRDQANEKIHVLMPSTACCADPSMPESEERMAMEPHEVSLVYDLGYDDPNSHEPIGKARTVCLQRCAMDTSAISDDAPVLSLPSEMLDLTCFMKPNATLESTVLPPDSDPKLLLDGRLTLSNGRLSETLIGGSFAFQGTATRRAWGIEWTVCSTKASVITWHVPGLSGAKARDLTLYPIDNMLDLFIYHFPRSQEPTLSALCGAPESGAEAKHFRAHYQLFNSINAVQLSTFPKYEPSAKGCHGSFRGVTPYTCLPGSITHP